MDGLIGVAGIDISSTLVSSAVVAAVVAAGSSFLTQRYLLERKAQVDYQYEARKRLNEVIGPLRMQLLFAARDVVRRTRGHISHGWDMDPAGSFVRSSIYRFLRPLAISQVIERQMSIADFGVDPGGIALLRFNTAAERMLTGNEVVLDYPHTDWFTQSQHLFRDNLRAAAFLLIDDEGDRQEVIGYAEFQRKYPDIPQVPELKDLALIFQSSGDSLTKNPVFWLRLLGYAYACADLIARQGASVGFEDIRLPVEELLRNTDDEHIALRADDYKRAFDAILAQGL